MNIVIIGSGGREHAIMEKLQSENPDSKVFMTKEPDDYDSLYKFVKKANIELIVVGSELPLENGIVDYFREKNIKIFGPTKEVAKFETSKVFAKEFMKKYSIPTSHFRVFTNRDDAKEYILSKDGNLVVKYDALAFGKGSFICNSVDDVYSSLDIIEKKFAKTKDFNFILEEILYGKEISIMSVIDSKNIVTFQPARDYKPLLDGDLGGNTGGMGAYTPVDFVTDDILLEINENIIKKTLDGIKKENIYYNGFLYFGIILTKDGAKLLEYNVRLGDPETEVLLPAMKSSLTKLILDSLDGNLKDSKIEFDNRYFIDLVLASKGYPENYETGKAISIDNDFNYYDNKIFYSAVKYINGEFLTDGGRVMNLVVSGETLEEASEKLYKSAEKINFEGIYYRKDIGRG